MGLDLRYLRNLLHAALEKETTESLTEWLNSKRDKNKQVAKAKEDIRVEEEGR